MSSDTSSCARAAGQFNESLECVAQVANLLQVLTKRIRLWPRADDEHIARIQPAIEALVKQNAINEAAQSHADGHQADRFKHDAAGNGFSSDQIERAGEEQAGGQAGLGAHSLFVEKICHVHRRVEMQTPAGDNESEGKAA